MFVLTNMNKSYCIDEMKNLQKMFINSEHGLVIGFYRLIPDSVLYSAVHPVLSGALHLQTQLSLYDKQTTEGGLTLSLSDPDNDQGVRAEISMNR